METTMVYWGNTRLRDETTQSCCHGVFLDVMFRRAGVSVSCDWRQVVCRLLTAALM